MVDGSLGNNTYYSSLDESPGIPRSHSSDPFSIVQDFDSQGNEIMYRSLSPRDYRLLERMGEIPATGETFLSPLESYSRGYDGNLVRFTVEKGTMDNIFSIGGYGNKGTSQLYPELPHAAKGWKNDMSQIKLEGQGVPYINNGNGVVNTGLGTGDALDLFNHNILQYELLN